MQLDAGVDAIQVFDSWAGTLSLADYRTYVLPHSSRVFAALAETGVPMTHFGVGTAELLGAMSGVARCHRRRRGLADVAGRRRRRGSAPGTALQGNLDPVVLLAGWPAVERAARAVVDDGRRAVDAGAAGPHLQPRPRRAAGHRSGRPDRAGGVGALAVTCSVLRCRRRHFGPGRGVPAACLAGDDADITVFDPADRLGGVLRTEQRRRPADGHRRRGVRGAPARGARAAGRAGPGRPPDRHHRRAAADLQPGPPARAAARHRQRHPDSRGVDGRPGRRRHDRADGRRTQRGR